MNKIAIRVKDLSKVYKLYPNNRALLKEALHPFRRKYHRDFHALKNVSFEVKVSEVVGIVGKNGSGKSTLLKILSGVLQPSRGTVQTNGNISALLELGAGFNPEFTGIENIYFYGSTTGFSRNEIEHKLHDILSFADIGDFASQPVKIYSNGMKARLAFAVAINIDPEILMVDEVLAVGDDLFKRKCYARIERFRNQGISILFVSHDIGTINELCTRALLIDEGQLILEGTPKLVTTHYQRLLYAKPEDIFRVRNQIITMNQDEQVKRKAENQVLKQKSSRARQKQGRQRNKHAKEEHAETIGPKAFFAPHFQSQSVVEYKNYDVNIYDCHIQTLQGQKVNHLVTDDEYIYTYKVKFSLDAHDVSFGMQLKTEKGIRLSGAALQNAAKTIKTVRNGDTYLVEWYFTCRLLEGIYYTNAGVSAIINGQRVYLNRLVDAVCFRVQHRVNSMYAGFSHFNQTIVFNKIG